MGARLLDNGLPPPSKDSSGQGYHLFFRGSGVERAELLLGTVGHLLSDLWTGVSFPERQCSSGLKTLLKQ